jgi:hypothetical protein
MCGVVKNAQAYPKDVHLKGVAAIHEGWINWAGCLYDSFSLGFSSILDALHCLQKDR